MTEGHFWGICFCIIICGVVIVHTLEKILKRLETISRNLYELREEARRN